MKTKCLQILNPIMQYAFTKCDRLTLDCTWSPVNEKELNIYN